MPEAAITRSTTPDLEVIRQAARTHAYDWYLAALLSPRRARQDLFVTAAYAGEILRIPAIVTEPMIGAIRLQWWRDAIDADASHTTSNPLADALRDCMQRYRLPVVRLAGILDAQDDALTGGIPNDAHARALRDNKVWGALFDLNARILSPGEPPLDPDLVHDAAIAYGAAVRRLWTEDAEMRNDITEEAAAALARVRVSQPAIAPAMRAALLPVALVEAYLQCTPGLDQGPSELAKAWAMLKAKLRGRV